MNEKENAICKNLKKYRLKCDMTQEEVAKALNKTPQTYSRYETGTSQPDIQTLIEIADLYHISLDYLTGRARTADEILGLLPGYGAGQALGDAILRKRATKRSKKDKNTAKEATAK